MAIGVTSDMATPALIKFGSEELKQQFLVPTISGDFVACLGVSEAGAGSDVASVKTTAVKKGGESSDKKEAVLKRIALLSTQKNKWMLGHWSNNEHIGTATILFPLHSCVYRKLYSQH